MKLSTFAAVAALCASGAGAQTMPLDEAAKKFGARPSAWGAELSPSGERIVYLSGGNGAETTAYVYDIRTNTARPFLSSAGDPESLNWCDFASEERLICGFGGVEKYIDMLVPFSRVIAIGTDGQDPKGLGRRSRGSDEYVVTGDGSIIDWLPGQDGEVLMTRHYVPEANRKNTRIINTDKGLGVDRIDVTSLKSRQVEGPLDGVAFYRTDGAGNVRIKAAREMRADQPTGVYHFEYRTADSNSWRDLGSYNSLTNEGMWPLTVDRDSNSLYFLRETNGRDALYRMKLDGSGAAEVVAANDRVDIDGVVRIDKGQRVIGYHYQDELPRVEYFDPEMQSLANALGGALGDDVALQFLSASEDGQKLLILASSDDDPGLYYLFNKQTKQLEPLFAARASLEGSRLANVQPITYKAADGVDIPAYLTVAEDGNSGPRPAVVLPHGGPSARDNWGFDWLAQFLAARGYAVIQPNYRGSAGYGSDFLGENAFRDWEKAMSDIASAADHLVAAGVADPEKIAILGWSYGGYAALQSAAMDTGTYKAAVAIAPVTDIGQLAQDARDYGNRRMIRQITGGGDHARRGSPLHNASAIKQPVLLVHGDMDLNVFKEHSIRMENALSGNGTDVTLLRYENLDHGLRDSTARTEMLMAIGKLLDRTIGK